MDSQLCTEQQVPSGVLTGINFNILNDIDAEKVSVLTIEAANEVTDPKLGMPNPTSQCPTCGANDAKNCEGHFGVIKFPFTVLHPYFISETAQILNQICPGCKSIRRDRVKGARSKRQLRNCKYCDGSVKEFYPQMKFKVSSNDMFGKTAILVEVKEKLSNKSQNRNSGQFLASDYWDIIPKDVQQDENSMRPNRRILSHAQVYHMLKDVDPRLLKDSVFRKNSPFLNCFLVTPNCHRVAEFGQHVVFDERTRAFKKLVDFRGTANDLSLRVLDGLKTSKIRSEQLDSGSSISGLKHIKELILGKRTDHACRMVIVGDPNILLSEIGVPCHIAERLQVSEHLNAWNWEKLNTCCNLRILEKGELYVRRKDDLVRVTSMGKLQIGDTVYRPLNDGDIVLINRPPSIHQHSLIALSVKVLPINSVLSINPLICSPFRGDFDGDCLHGYVPQSIDSRIELQELVALDRQLTNGQSGRNLLSLSHDSLTAAHLVVEDGVLLNLLQMQQLQMFCPQQLQLPAIVKAPLINSCLKAATSRNNTRFWSGKQLFSLLLPPDFDYAFPSDGVHICKGEVLASSDGSSWLRDTEGNLLQCLVKHCQEKTLDFLYAAQNVLCEWLSMRGLSVSLSDFYLSSDSYYRKNMIGEVSCGLREAERISHIKLLMVDSNLDFLTGSEESLNAMDFGSEHMCYEKQKSAALSRVSVSAFKQVFWDIQNLVYQYASKENSLLSMLKAGSKGNLTKLVQHSMCLGLQHSLVPLPFRMPHDLSCAAWNNHKAPASSRHIPECAGPGRYIPYAVVENSFLSGLNPLECFVHSLTARDTSFSDNADLPGTLSRRLMFFMRDLYIGYDGTVRNAYGNQVVQFSYNTEGTAVSSNATNGSFHDSTYATRAMGGQPVGSLAACAISEAAYSALDQPISALETSPLLNLKKILECGVKKSTGNKTASLFLSKKLRRWTHGFEYAALEVQSHLERLLFSDIVSTVMILFSVKTCSRKNTSPWVCHFHINKEIAKRRRLKLHSIVNALYMNCNSTSARSKTNLPKLHITSNNCLVDDMQKENNATVCITVTMVESSRNSGVQLDYLKDMVIPVLLGTVVKGHTEGTELRIQIYSSFKFF
ncbi:DNA-directed RNA polymerase [Sarracenia purpurea var. burkii]